MHRKSSERIFKEEKTNQQSNENKVNNHEGDGVLWGHTVRGAVSPRDHGAQAGTGGRRAVQAKGELFSSILNLWLQI